MYNLVMPHPHVARSNSSILVVVDVQEPFAKAMADRDTMVSNIITLARVARINQVPIIVTEQNAKRLGPTIPEVASVLKELEVYDPIDKMVFSCYASEPFVQRVYDLGRDTLILVGMEAHVCIAQTALEALSLGYRAHVVQDAVTSRRPADFRIAMDKLRHAGAVISSTEMVSYELLGEAGTSQFKEAMQYLKW